MQQTWFYGPLFKLKLLFIQSEMQKKKDGFRESLKRNSQENHYKKRLDSKGTFEERFFLFASFR